MRWILLLLLCGCVSEVGEVNVVACPNCENAYSGFDSCVFYDVDEPYYSENMLVDYKNHIEGVPIKVRGYMHHKFCFNESHSATGSANPTTNGLTKNDNLVVRFESVQMAKNFASEFNYLIGEGYGWHKKKWRFNGKPIEQYFCPRDSCEKRIIKTLSEAQDSIVFLTFSFTSDEIGDLLVEKHKKGVIIQGILEGRSRNIRGSEFNKLEKSGIKVHLAKTPGVMHHKAFIIDNKTAIFGSYNPSNNANKNNAETVIITEEPEIITTLLEEFSRLSP